MKALKYSLFGLILLIVIAIVGMFLYLEPLVKTTVNTVGTKIVGTQVNLEGFRFSPFAGEVEIKGLTVANPEGYKASNLIDLGNVYVKVNVPSLLKETIIVEKVSVNGISLTYEMPDLSTSNVMQIQQNIAKNTTVEKTLESEDIKEEVQEKTSIEPSSSKNIIIKKVVVDGGSLNAIIPLQPEALTLNMPAIEINGIGEGEKMSIQSSVTNLFNKILFNATSVVTKYLTDAKNIVNDVANKTLNDVKSKSGEEVGSLFEKVKFW